jgi:hypothetical protein
MSPTHNKQIVRDKRFGHLLAVEDVDTSSVLLRYLHTGATMVVTPGMLLDQFETADPCPHGQDDKCCGGDCLA